MTNEAISGLGEWLDDSAPVPERESSEAALRQGVLAGVERLVRRRRGRAITSVAAGVVLVVTIGVGRWASESRQQEAIQFQVLPDMAMGRVGAYVAPTGDAQLDLKFTEGSVVKLRPGARARVAATTARGATVLLETGRASVEVMHRKHADWTIMAGPYSVRVHGTAFTVEFDSKTQLFDLAMRSGVVTVEGPGISQPVEIRGAQHFVHHAGSGPEVPESRASQRSSALPVAAPADAPESDVLASGDQVASAPDAMAQVSSSSVAPTWEARVRRGEYSAVVRDAERRGIPHVLSNATAHEMMALGNAARFLGRIELGRSAYKALRQRFSGTSAAVAAAFLMGRLTEASAPQEAHRWYERYEQEAPRGPFVAEAVGRRLLLTQTTGSRAEVRRLAEDYVRRFPDGPYAGVARKIVSP